MKSSGTPSESYSRNASSPGNDRRTPPPGRATPRAAADPPSAPRRTALLRCGRRGRWCRGWLSAPGRRRPSRLTTTSTSVWSSGSREPELLAVPHRAAHDLAQHVAAPLVRRDDAVGDEERHRAQVVGDHAHRDVGRVVRSSPRVLPPARSPIAARIGVNRVGVVVRSLPWMTEVIRSRPMPVSIDGAGSGLSVPSACRSNSMNTLFQISTNRSQLQSSPRQAGRRAPPRRASRARGDSGSLNSGRTGRCRPSARSCPPGRAR